MREFHDIFENRHAYAKKWKERTGGKVLGYYTTYFPEEVAYAGGMLPVRIMAKHEPDSISDRHIYASCIAARDMLNQFYLGRYDYVDAIIHTEGCQWLFHTFESTLSERPELKSHYLFFPDYAEAPTSKYALRSELNVLKGKVEEWTGNTITDEALDHAIEVYNKYRSLVRRIYQMRREASPVIHGAEAMEIMLATQVMDKAEAIPLLEELIAELETREGGEDRVRLLLLGSETWDTSLEEIAESVGADFVIDELDNGSSYCWNNIIPLSDRLQAIGMRYLDKPRSPIRDDNYRRRPQHIFDLIEDWGVDGVVIEKQILCHLHGTDNYAVWKLLRDRYVPFHFLERDNTNPVEETTLRLEAFVNVLKPSLNHIHGWSTQEARDIDEAIRQEGKNA